MPEENFILVSLDDARSKEISEVLGSDTCKKIINYLAEHKEASQKDLSDKLKIPMNTLDYNMKKLLSSGFIQKRKNFFWSTKGKKIIMYEISNKSIVISHKKSTGQKLKSIIPAFILAVAGTFAVGVYEKITAIENMAVSSACDTAVNFAQKAEEEISRGAMSATAESPSMLLSPQPFPMWGWFLAGAVLVMLIFSIVNWRKL